MFIDSITHAFQSGAVGNDRIGQGDPDCKALRTQRQPPTKFRLYHLKPQRHCRRSQSKDFANNCGCHGIRGSAAVRGWLYTPFRLGAHFSAHSPHWALGSRPPAPAGCPWLSFKCALGLLALNSKRQVAALRPAWGAPLVRRRLQFS